MMATRSRGITRALEPFLHALHSSASVPEVRATYTRFANELVPDGAYGWYEFKRGTVEPEVVNARGVSDRFLSLYESEGRKLDPIFAKVAVELTSISSDHHLSAREQRSFKFQTELSSGRLVRAIQAPLAVAGELVGTINIAPAPNAPAFSRDDVKFFDVISRHASIALARIAREQELREHCTWFEAALDVFGQPLVLTGPDGSVIFATRAAAKYASVLAAGLLTTADMLASEQRRVAAAIVPDETDSRLPHDPERARLAVKSVRLGETGVVISFLYPVPKDKAEGISELTKREREIAQFVVRGFNNADIALVTSISRNTVKQHLKHIFEKLQVSSRAELAAAVARCEAKGIANAPLESRPAILFPDDGAGGRVSAVSVLSRYRRRH
jgi:DNA-binding CsgD family transcriptional regulator